MPRKPAIAKLPRSKATPKAKPIKVAAPKATARKIQGRAGPIKVRAPAGLEIKGEPMRRPDGHRFEALASGDDVTTIDIYDVIGDWGVSARQFRSMLNAIRTSRIVLRINSPGGSVFDGVAIYNDLIAHPARIEVQITGLAASAASLIAMAGDTVEIADNAFLMIHNTWTVGVGDRRTMASAARTLERFDAAFARTYASKTGLDVAELAEMMDAETWLDAGDAVSMGFADAVTDEAEGAQGRFDLSPYVKAPAALKGNGKSSTPKAPEAKAPRIPEASALDLSSMLAALAQLEATMRGTNDHQNPAAARSA